MSKKTAVNKEEEDKWKKLYIEPRMKVQLLIRKEISDGEEKTISEMKENKRNANIT